MIRTKRSARLAAGCIVAALIGAGAPAGAVETLSGAYLAAKHAANQSDVEAAARYYSRALDRDPGDVELMEQVLIYATATGELDDALLVAERLETFEPGHRIANLLLVAQAMKDANYDEVRRRIAENADALHPLISDLMGAWAAEGAGDEEAAQAALDRLGDRTIMRIFAGYHAGLMHHAAGDVEAALKSYKTAVEDLQTPTGRIARAYAAALRDEGDDEAARAVYDAALGISFGDGELEADIASVEAGAPPTLLVKTPAEGAAEALYGLSAALAQDGGTQLSLFYARLAIYLRPDFSDAKLLAAELLDASEQNELAIRVYDSIPADSPLSRAAEIGRAAALQRMGEEDEAAEALKALVEREPDSIEAHIALGDMMRRVERFSEGARAYDDAIRLMEESGRPKWVLYYERGICLERSGEFDRAEADFLKALEMQPDQPLVLNYLGYSWLEKGRNLERAMDMIRSAVAARPDDGYIIDSLGWGYYLLKDYPNAVTQLERAVEYQPVDPVINDHFGDALWRVGRKLEARFQWRRALSFEPEPEDAERIKRKLDVGLDAADGDAEDAADAAGEAAKANDG